MLGSALLFISLVLNWTGSSESSPSDTGQFGSKLVEKMTNDANLDLSVDEEYEDLRAELLAYHAVLASLAPESPTGRRSMGTTPCWMLGGICIDYKLCSGFRFLTEVPGCKDKLNVCCFAWNRYKVRDLSHHGLGHAGFPWSLKYEFGGEGIKVKSSEEAQKVIPQLLRKRFDDRRGNKTLAFILQ